MSDKPLAECKRCGQQWWQRGNGTTAPVRLNAAGLCRDCSTAKNKESFEHDHDRYANMIYMHNR